MSDTEDESIGSKIVGLVIVFGIIFACVWFLKTQIGTCDIVIRQGHEYNRCYEGGESLSVTHSPDCPKCKDEKK